MAVGPVFLWIQGRHRVFNLSAVEPEIWGGRRGCIEENCLELVGIVNQHLRMFGTP